MDLLVLIKGNSKYIVEDKKSRLLYTIKKKGFGNIKYILLDASNYNLYTLLNTTSTDSKPSFSVFLNDSIFMRIECKSRFLEPEITCEGKEGKNLSYSLISQNRRDFTIVLNGEEKGRIETNVSVSGELQYDITIDDKVFDDYIPLFAVVVDKIYGDANKNPEVIHQIMEEKKGKAK
ncbi:MAG: hypothetical protein K2K02_10980 [Ruminococcus sp.]|nr:hypothetical protein [Ruminococcus sp.]MDE6679550.1 hypothetical protein [Ruminococcus sp.]